VCRRQYRGKHHGRDEQPGSGRPTDAAGNHAGILSGAMNKVRPNSGI
jgi:hypothetical protein